MDDLYALEGGGSATAWQRRHNRRKHREAALNARRALRAEAKADLKKRTRKWREKWKAQAAANKAAGLPPPSRKGRPRDMKRPQWLDMTGWRFGRLTVIRVAPISSNGKNHGRRWWVKCDCGTGEKRVAGTNLRQGKLLSCGCLKSERVRSNHAAKRAKMEELNRSPLSIRVADLRHRLLKNRTTRADAKLIELVRLIVVLEEVRQGIRRTDKNGRAVLVRGLRANAGEESAKSKPTLH